MSIAGADPGFQARGAYLKKLRRAEGGAKDFGVFRVKNHDFTLKNLFFFNGSAPVSFSHAQFMSTVLKWKVFVYCLKM
jgi:hypothetical protein